MLKHSVQHWVFSKKFDVPLGERNRWLTVVSKEEPEGTEILLEPSPNHLAETKRYQKALFDKGIPYTQFMFTMCSKNMKGL